MVPVNDLLPVASVRSSDSVSALQVAGAQSRVGRIRVQGATAPEGHLALSAEGAQTRARALPSIQLQ